MRDIIFTHGSTRLESGFLGYDYGCVKFENVMSSLRGSDCLPVYKKSKCHMISPIQRLYSPHINESKG